MKGAVAARNPAKTDRADITVVGLAGRLALGRASRRIEKLMEAADALGPAPPLEAA